MPYYDRLCNGCGDIRIDVLEPVNVSGAICARCGQPTVRAWLTKPSAVIGDEIDHLQVNGLKEPRRFRSRQERQRWMKAEGFREFVRHLPGDKHTEGWSTMDQRTLDNARELVERASKEPARNEPKDDALNVITYSGIGTPSRSDFERGRR